MQPFGHGSLRGYLHGSMFQCCSLHPIRTPHAWPTLSATRKGVSLKSFLYICSCSFIELWGAKVRSELQIYVAACYDLYQKKMKALFMCMLTRRSLCTALRFIRCGVASMESHSSMRIKKNQNTKMTMELEVYLPVPSSVEM